ncbi:DeoR/GlpR family DNA-binding transcription regulator [Halovulum marinum]|uniref:DeoR/GlpR family DNA-binding transcription regulator n=1 Tax=Halovulum marinum TaxID=2662447 RepID=UPI002D79FA6E|nr:DeoR/GlpR family DNA-binding transcription regulator [Halovulum marinum]
MQRVQRSAVSHPGPLSIPARHMAQVSDRKHHKEPAHARGGARHAKFRFDKKPKLPDTRLKDGEEGAGVTDRRETILAMVRQQGRVRAEDMARVLNTSVQTIRKDLRALEAEGQITRFHGGAVPRAGRDYIDYEVRRAIAAPQKRAIGRAAIERIPRGATVFVNAGTTTEAAVRAIQPGSGLTVIADNVNLANIIRKIDGVTTMIAGGKVRAADGAVVGATAVAFLDQFRADYALIGAAAIGREGALLDFDLDEAMVVRAMIRNAGRVAVLADSGKFGATAAVRIGDMRDAWALVTDRCPGGVRRLCQSAGVEVVETAAATLPRAVDRSA